MRFSKFAFVPFLGLLISTSAQAQMIGTYNGTAKDGSSVLVTVAQDPNDANLEVTVIGYGVTMLCQKSKETVYYVGIGLNDGSDIVNKKFSYSTSNFDDIDLVTSMTFKGRSVSGKIGSNVSTFNPTIGHTKLTKDVQVCVGPSQPFTATFSGPAATKLPAQAAMTVSDGKSTVKIGVLPSK